jgi:hypothetical protein
MIASAAKARASLDQVEMRGAREVLAMDFVGVLGGGGATANHPLPVTILVPPIGPSRPHVGISSCSTASVARPGPEKLSGVSVENPRASSRRQDRRRGG